MSRRLPSKDVVIIGLGWTGAIMAQELTEEGLEGALSERRPTENRAHLSSHPQLLPEAWLALGLHAGQASRYLCAMDRTLSAHPSSMSEPLGLRSQNSIAAGLESRIEVHRA
jgi:choline dehydrogenase-like flavoprotein